MTYAHVGTIQAKPGARDRLIAILTRANPALAAAGCLSYEVGVNDDEPQLVYVAELWVSAEAHRASLGLDSVREAIAEAMPLLTGTTTGHGFRVTGSPLRD